MAKFCTRCGRQCLDKDMICPACGQMLAVDGVAMKQTKTQTSKGKMWIIIGLVVAMIIGLLVVGSLFGVGGVSRQQSDADIAVLGGEATYNRREKINDSMIDVFYTVEAQKDLLDYTYECQLRYVKTELGWSLTEKEMKLLDYKWKLAGTTWESEENGTYGNTKKYSFYIKSISKDDITVQYRIQDIRTNEVEEGEEYTYLDRLTDLSYIYIEDDGLISGGDIRIESDEIPIHFAINFSEMRICYSKNLLLGFSSMTKVQGDELLFESDEDEEIEENLNQDIEMETTTHADSVTQREESIVEENDSDSREELDSTVYFELDGKKMEFPCTLKEFEKSFPLQDNIKQLSARESAYAKLKNYIVEICVENRTNETQKKKNLSVTGIYVNESNSVDFSTIRGLKFGMLLEDVEDALQGVQYEYSYDHDGYEYYSFEYGAATFILGGYGGEVQYIAISSLDK